MGDMKRITVRLIRWGTICLKRDDMREGNCRGAGEQFSCDVGRRYIRHIIVSIYYLYLIISPPITIEGL